MERKDLNIVARNVSKEDKEKILEILDKDSEVDYKSFDYLSDVGVFFHIRSDIIVNYDASHSESEIFKKASELCDEIIEKNPNVPGCVYEDGNRGLSEDIIDNYAELIGSVFLDEEEEENE